MALKFDWLILANLVSVLSQFNFWFQFMILKFWILGAISKKTRVFYAGMNYNSDLTTEYIFRSRKQSSKRRSALRAERVQGHKKNRKNGLLETDR